MISRAAGRFPVMGCIGFAWFCAASLAADKIPVTVQSTITPTQAIIQYTATSATCTIAVANQSGLGATVWDLDGSTFANANNDTGRPDTLQDGMDRTVILGHRSVEKGLDGKLLLTRPAGEYSTFRDGHVRLRFRNRGFYHSKHPSRRSVPRVADVR